MGLSIGVRQQKPIRIGDLAMLKWQPISGGQNMYLGKPKVEYNEAFHLTGTRSKIAADSGK